MKPVKYTKAQFTARMVTPEKYACESCEGTGRIEDGHRLIDCEPCDGIGITAIECPGCNREAIPIHETVFVAAYPQTYCEPCGDRELERLAVQRAR